MVYPENKQKFEEILSLLKSIANERRFLVLCALHKGEKTVSELEKIIGSSQSALSQHLARLRADGIVKTRRDAQNIYYSLADDRAVQLFQSLCALYEVSERGFSFNLEDLARGIVPEASAE